jgi:hypothetical protein
MTLKTVRNMAFGVMTASAVCFFGVAAGAEDCECCRCTSYVEGECVEVDEEHPSGQDGCTATPWSCVTWGTPCNFIEG